MASASGGAKKNAPIELKSQTERPKNYSVFNYSKQLNLISAILLDNLVSFYKSKVCIPCASIWRTISDLQKVPLV